MIKCKECGVSPDFYITSQYNLVDEPTFTEACKMQDFYEMFTNAENMLNIVCPECNGTKFVVDKETYKLITDNWDPEFNISGDVEFEVVDDVCEYFEERGKECKDM